MLSKPYNQRGRGIGRSRYKGDQRGGGIAQKVGSFFSRILRNPWVKKGVRLAKKGAKSVGKTVIKTGAEALGDVITQRKKPKEAFQEGVEKIKGEVAEKADKALKKMAGGRKRKYTGKVGSGKKTNKK